MGLARCGCNIQVQFTWPYKKKKEDNLILFSLSFKTFEIFIVEYPNC